jgi:hypothetical protein
MNFMFFDSDPPMLPTLSYTSRCNYLCVAHLVPLRISSSSIQACDNFIIVYFKTIKTQTKHQHSFPKPEKMRKKVRSKARRLVHNEEQAQQRKRKSASARAQAQEQEQAQEQAKEQEQAQEQAQERACTESAHREQPEEVVS